MSARRDVIVIGAGHNGLTTAALLAARGRRVLVLERRDVLGGLAGLLHDTTCVRPDVAQTLDLERHGLAWDDAPPVFVPQADGPGLLLHLDAGRAETGIREACGPRDAERYADFRRFVARTRSFVNALFSDPGLDRAIADPGGGALDLLKTGLTLRRLGRRDMLEMLRLVPMSVADWLGEWFESDVLASALAGPAVDGTFTGPRSPGSNASLLRLEAARGSAVRGGPQALVDALERAARSRGVEIRTGAEVERITIGRGRVESVTLAGGEEIAAGVVAASCDPRRTFLNLLDGRDLAPRLEARIRSYRMRGTTAKVNLALGTPLRFACRPDLAVEHARIGERLDDLERAFDAVKYGRFSEQPILDVRCSAAGAASILAHFVPYDLDGGWNGDQRERLGDAVVEALERYAPGTRASIAQREVLAPPDIEARYGVTGGHIHHGEHALDQLLVRPCPDCAGHRTPIEGLYLCGSGTLPAGGLTCAPGAQAASAML